MKNEVEFDSDEMDALTLKLKNVWSVYTAHRVFAQFDGREPAYGIAPKDNRQVARADARFQQIDHPLQSIGSRAGRPWFRRYPVAIFLVALALSMVLSPFEERFKNGDLSEVVRITLVLLLALPALGGRHKTIAVGLALVTPAVMGKWLNHLRPDLLPAWTFLVPALLFMGFVVLHLLLFIIRAPRVDSEVLCAGVAGYLMVGLLWAAAYILEARLAPDSFVFTVGPPGSQSMQGFTGLYYSFITLTTVGYGDIVPVSSVARMLAMTEAMTGTLYMAILVARLVSLYYSPSPSTQTSELGQLGFLPTDLDRQQTTINTSTP